MYNNSVKQNYLEESLKSSILKERLNMNELIDQVNRLKLSQNEANEQFQKKMDELAKQNELIKNYNKDLLSQIKEMKYAVKDREDNPEIINDYLIEERNKRNNNLKNFIRNDNMIRNNINYKKISEDEKLNNYNDFKSIDYNYKNYFLGKNDKDVEEFNDLNQNLVNGNGKVVVSPLIYNKNNNKNIKFDNFDKNENNKDDIYSLLRKNNDRLEKIKELEEKFDYDKE